MKKSTAVMLSTVIGVFSLSILITGIILVPRWRGSGGLTSGVSGPREREVREINSRIEDIFTRHPDLPLTVEFAFWLDFRDLPPGKQVRKIKDMRQFHQSLAEVVFVKVLGPDKEQDLERYKTFSPNGWKHLSDSIEYPGTNMLEYPPFITGNRQADERVAAIAERRGYRLRSAADEASLITLGRHKLHPMAADAWNKIVEAASRDGIELGIISAYRPVEYQRQIFLRLLQIEAGAEIGREYTVEEIADGKADSVINRILETSSIPGYSKHHSGYTLDITDLTSGKPYEEFGSTPGFAWISADNYLNAKRFGFIPSYPEGSANQGPVPEPWEYVWVGEEVLLSEPRAEVH